MQPVDFVRRHKLHEGFRLQIRGEQLRDWSSEVDEAILFPYNPDLTQWVEIPKQPQWSWFHNLRTLLWARTTFGGGTYRSDGRTWFDYHQFPKDRARTPLSIAFAFVATHNHFVLDRGGKVFNRSAPIIKLPANATEAEHLALLGLLNSSTACFWMKQVCAGKHKGDGGQAHADPAYQRFEFDGTKLQRFPLAVEKPLNFAIELDRLAQERQVHLPPN